MFIEQGLGDDAIEWLGVRYRTLLSRNQTDGRLSVVDSLSPPNSGPPRHIHHDADETFILLSGDVEFWVEGQTFLRHPGAVVFVPRGAEHTFKVTASAPSRHLVVLNPGGFEGFFEEMAANRYAIPGDMAAIGKCASRFAMTFTGPPL